MSNKSKVFKKFEKLFVRPGSVQVDLTNRCNLNCIYCYNRANLLDSNRKELSDKEWEFVVAKIIKQLNPLTVTFSGGEPFLRFRLMLKLAKKLKENDIYVHINTNGLLIDADKAKALKKFDIDQLNINIDSFKKQDFLRGGKRLIPKLSKSLKNLKKYFYSQGISISCVVNKLNYREILDIADFVRVNDFKEIHFLDMIPCMATDKNFLLSKKEWLEFFELCKKVKDMDIQIRPNHALLFLAEFKKIVKFPFCMAGRFKMVITASGQIVPCNYFKKKEFLCGNVLKDDLLKVWKNSPIMKKFRYFIPKEKKCQNCEFFKLCTGGCRALALTILGDAFKADPYCLLYNLKNAAK